MQLALIIAVWTVDSGYNFVGTADYRSECKPGALCEYTARGQEFKHRSCPDKGFCKVTVRMDLSRRAGLQLVPVPL